MTLARHSLPDIREAQRPLLHYLRQRTDALPCLWTTDEGNRLAYDAIDQDLRRLVE